MHYYPPPQPRFRMTSDAFTIRVAVAPVQHEFGCHFHNDFTVNVVLYQAQRRVRTPFKQYSYDESDHSLPNFLEAKCENGLFRI